MEERPAACFLCLICILICPVSAIGTVASPDLMADAGGPYFSSPGSEIVFDAGKSKSTGRIVDYLWEFGDNSSGRGQTARHIFREAGLYRVTLSVADDAGRKSVDSKVVYVSSQTIYISLEVFPLRESRSYGDIMSYVEAYSSYYDGSVVEDAFINGSLSGKNRVPLTFTSLGGGRYRADIDYTITEGDGDFMDLSVAASDASGRHGKTVKKIACGSSDVSLWLLVEKPDSKVFAPGQRVRFSVKMMSMEGLLLEGGEVALYETWSGKKYVLSGKDDIYNLDYDIPADAPDRMILTLYGKASSGDRKYLTVKELNLSLSHELSVKLVGLSDRQEMILNITYPDGSTVSDNLLKASLANASVFLEKRGELFYGFCASANGSKSYIWVTDVYGSSGGAEVDFPGKQSAGFDQPQNLIIFAAVGIVILAVIPLLVGRYGKEQARRRLLDEYEDAMRSTESLEMLKKGVMHDYYTRKITESEARKRIFDCEKELVFQNAHITKVLKKLCMAKQETVDGQDMLEWIAKKLRSGEDPSVLRKGLRGMGLDPGMVDRVRKAMK